MAMSKKVLFAELARRKLQFHPDQEYDQINLWCIGFPSAIRRYVDSGMLLLSTQNKLVPGRAFWFKPSKETWEIHVKPLTEKYTIDELTRMAGWL
jgi:hypothetical protein